MTCRDCALWRPVGPKFRFGFCRWAEGAPEPYWRAKHLSGWLITHLNHGAECAALRPWRKP